MDPYVSVIVPSFNEEKSIASLLDNILEQDYPGDRLEVFIVDGMSADGTCDIIRNYSLKHPFIHLLVNEKRFVPFALNKGIIRSKGEVIIRLDAHSLYPVNYISMLVRYLFELKADNVGGVWETLPSGKSAKAIAIAVALSSVFGVGNSMFRVGVKEIRKVDTVPYGCFRKELFDRIGLFDEDLLRNQDDEFNARIIENGGTIYLIPGVVITYFARPDITSLARMLYQYGYFKPLVNKKIKRPATIRQFVPPLFVLFLFTGWAPAFISSFFLYFYFGLLALYVLTGLFFTLKQSIADRCWYIRYLPWIFLIQHLAYGFGYIRGMVNLVILRKSQKTIATSR